MRENKEIDFIARHYNKSIFDTERVLRKVRPTRRFGWTKTKAVAASVLVAVIGATAAVLIHNDFFMSSPDPTVDIPSVVTSPEKIVRIIDFEDAPLPMVVEQIEVVYGVTVAGVPTNAESYRLSLHYEGTATDLVETINDILELHLHVSSR